MIKRQTFFTLKHLVFEIPVRKQSEQKKCSPIARASHFFSIQTIVALYSSGFVSANVYYIFDQNFSIASSHQFYVYKYTF